MARGCLSNSRMPQCPLRGPRKARIDALLHSIDGARTGWTPLVLRLPSRRCPRRAIGIIAASMPRRQRTSLRKGTGNKLTLQGPTLLARRMLTGCALLGVCQRRSRGRRRIKCSIKKRAPPGQRNRCDRRQACKPLRHCSYRARDSGQCRERSDEDADTEPERVRDKIGLFTCGAEPP